MLTPLVSPHPRPHSPPPLYIPTAYLSHRTTVDRNPRIVQTSPQSKRQRSPGTRTYSITRRLCCRVSRERGWGLARLPSRAWWWWGTSRSTIGNAEGNVDAAPWIGESVSKQEGAQRLELESCWITGANWGWGRGWGRGGAAATEGDGEVGPCV